MRILNPFWRITSAPSGVSIGAVGGSCFAAGVLVHYFSPDGWEGCSLRGRPAIRDKMPVLIDED